MRLERQVRILVICVLILTGMALATAMYMLRPVLIPLVLALLFTTCLTPVIDAQMRWLRMPRPIAILTTILVGCLALLAVGLLVSSLVAELSENAATYRDRITAMLNRGIDMLAGLGVDRDDLSGAIVDLPQQAANQVLSGTMDAITAVLSNGLLVIVFMVFLVAGKAARIDSDSAREPDESDGRIISLIETISDRTKRYVLTMIFISGVTGMLVGITLSILNVQFAWMFGALAFLLNFIPNIGSIIATLLPLPVVMLSPELTVASKIAAIVVPSVIQFVIGNLAAPKIMGESLGLHPVTVLASLIFFGWAWGVVGMFLATPITAVISILLDRIDETRPAAHLLAGRLREALRELSEDRPGRPEGDAAS